MVRCRAAALVTAAGILSLFAITTYAQGVWDKTWNNSGGGHVALPPLSTSPGPAPRRDLTGTWDAGTMGIAGGSFAGLKPSPFTPEGEKRKAANKTGNGDMAVINDPLETMGDVGGFPRNLLYELRPLQIVQTPQSMLMLHMWEKRWRAIWTDGRALPENPDPRWYGYSVGRWVDDTTFVVETNGTDERTWVDNGGNPHSTALRVEERYHRVNAEVLELTVVIDDPVVYTKPWTALQRLPLRLAPAGTDFMEMIPSATEAQNVYKILKEAVQQGR